MSEKLETLKWMGQTDGHLVLLDQTCLPSECCFFACHEIESLWQAIRTLKVRGAPAIGIAAAYGVVLGLQTATATSETVFFKQCQQAVDYLGTSRPTAVNLFWALRRMQQTAKQLRGTATPTEILARLLAEARAIHDEDRAICRAIGRHGAELLEDGMGVLTHCNAGWLATSEYGTALSAIYTAQDQGKRIHVFADETRPLQQGARLTTWELMRRNIDTTLICDSMAAQVMREGRVDIVITGADRIAANGDATNKIGTYGVALLARAHGIPFFVAAPCSTFDLTLVTGRAIPIEQRDAIEITAGMGRQTAPEGVHVYNPAFDVTPAELIEGIICERGLIRPVATERISAVVGS